MHTEIQQHLHDTNEQFIALFSSLHESQINVVPFEGSWSPAQVVEHVLKSEDGMVKALQASGKKVNRKADARVPELKDVFLNFNTRLQSPDFIVPEEKEYNKNELTNHFYEVMQQVAQAIEEADGGDAIVNPALGEMTKEEIVHFLLYHTQRHVHQLQHIIQTLHDKTKAMAATKEAIVRKVNAAFSKNDTPEFLSYCTGDITWNMVGTSSAKGKQAILQMMTAMPGGCPDIAIDTVFSEDDKTACTGTFIMKNKDGNSVRYSFCDIYYFQENKIQTLDSYVVETKQ